MAVASQILRKAHIFTEEKAPRDLLHLSASYLNGCEVTTLSATTTELSQALVQSEADQVGEDIFKHEALKPLGATPNASHNPLEQKVASNSAIPSLKEQYKALKLQDLQTQIEFLKQRKVSGFPRYHELIAGSQTLNTLNASSKQAFLNNY